jgi:hypothetical protein
MKNLILLLLIATAMSSCKSYMISTVSSDNASKDESSGALYIENDSVKITYAFTGENSQLAVEVFNKLNEPVYVNWGQSAVVLDNKAYSFVGDKLTFDGNTNTTTPIYNSSGSIDTYGNFAGSVNLSKDAGFLPPKSLTTRSIFALNNINTFKLVDASFVKKPMNFSNGSGVIYVKEANYDAAASPIQFRCFITLHTIKDGTPKPFSYEQSFWVSKIVKSPSNPSEIATYQYLPGNVIINSKTTGFGTAITGIALVGATGALIGAEAALAEKNNTNDK